MDSRSSVWNHTRSDPFSDQNSTKTLPFGAAHTLRGFLIWGSTPRDFTNDRWQISEMNTINLMRREDILTSLWLQKWQFIETLNRIRWVFQY